MQIFFLFFQQEKSPPAWFSTFFGGMVGKKPRRQHPRPLRHFATQNATSPRGRGKGVSASPSVSEYKTLSALRVERPALCTWHTAVSRTAPLALPLGGLSAALRADDGEGEPPERSPLPHPQKNWLARIRQPCETLFAPLFLEKAGKTPVKAGLPRRYSLSAKSFSSSLSAKAAPAKPEASS